ncbi:Transcriptional regulator, TetR family protein [Sandaracinus amylolyticus]|uniref:Transcriptional regulator, TetR family protein n=1 Tax=Sandaracinus amylolyticus TaxID=927083 RepID=A0A0F6WAL0_9BACT|nr:Transcriptional regulator, TetR family protein [Sandaracinus amylolyticus]
MIVDRACELVREHGLDALTMRAIAEALEATPMAIYHHVKDRDALVHLVVDRVVARIELPERTLAPVPWLREVAHRTRCVGLEHPGVMDVLLDEGPAVPSALRILDATVATLHDAGLGWAAATDVHNTFFSWLAGAIRREDRWRRQHVEGPPPFVALAETMPSRELPALRRALPRLRAIDLDAMFATSLELVLAGVEHQLERPRGRQDARR